MVFNISLLSLLDGLLVMDCFCQPTAGFTATDKNNTENHRIGRGTGLINRRQNGPSPPPDHHNQNIRKL